MKHGDKFWEMVHRFPPILCRILAVNRRGRGSFPRTTEEISRLSGLSQIKVLAISSMTNWDDVTIPDCRKFGIGCGTSFWNPRDCHRLKCYLNGKVIRGVRIPPTFSYLRRSKDFETYYKPLYHIYVESLKRKAGQ